MVALSVVSRIVSEVFFISSIKNIYKYKILITLLTKYSTILQIQYHEEQDIMSTPWLQEEKREGKKARLHRTILKKKFH